MHDVLTMVSALRRPRLLVRTARTGLGDYSRVRHLPRLLKTDKPLGPAAALIALLQREAEANEQRLAGAAEYSIALHVDLLIAIMAEADTLRAATRDRPIAVVS
ncbi:MAG: hypothetical protein HLUCCA08_14200 [Rhodobacteraceae bacterium HLUCCA08]|nr:MAG: hypothetical protein HLUCCA08_14200 [Rhodobacteraceae bacterium HLUCCA08]